MRTRAVLSAVMIGPFALLLAVTSCSTASKPKVEDSSAGGGAAAAPAGAPAGEARGAAVVDTVKASAKVTSIDKPNRTLTLTTDDGRQTTFKAGPEVRNFDQIRVGDQVKATLTEEFAVALRPSSAGPSAEAGTAVALAPKGAKPGIVMAETAEVTARITAIDAASREVTLQLPDGSTRRVHVAKDIDLTGVKVGDEVTARVTKSLLLNVEAP
jgi:hypothetical protein